MRHASPEVDEGYGVHEARKEIHREAQDGDRVERVSINDIRMHPRPWAHHFFCNEMMMMMMMMK